jgi:hypothetical protein
MSVQDSTQRMAGALYWGAFRRRGATESGAIELKALNDRSAQNTKQQTSFVRT